MTEHDVGELREFRAGLADPDAGRMARIRAKVTGGNSPHRARRGVLVPVAVAASVLAVGVGATVVAVDRSGGGSPVGSSPGSSPATVAEPTKSSSVPDPLAPGKHAAAVQLLEGFAAKAGAGPAALTVPAGKLLYVRTVEGPVNVHEMWVDVNGGMPVMIRRTENGKVTLLVPDPSNPKSDNTAELAQRRADLERLGPDLNRPTPEFLAGLPTDPDAMLGLLRGARGDGPWSPDHAIAGLVGDLLHVNQPLITPQGHAAINRSLAKLDSVAATGQPIDIGGGRQVYAIEQSERGQTEHLLFDPALGIVVGRGLFDPALGIITRDLWSYGVVDAAGETS